MRANRKLEGEIKAGNLRVLFGSRASVATNFLIVFPMFAAGFMMTFYLYVNESPGLLLNPLGLTKRDCVDMLFHIGAQSSVLAFMFLLVLPRGPLQRHHP